MESLPAMSSATMVIQWTWTAAAHSVGSRLFHVQLVTVFDA